MHKMPRRIELALRNAHRSLRVLEQLYFDGNSDK